MSQLNLKQSLEDNNQQIYNGINLFPFSSKSDTELEDTKKLTPYSILFKPSQIYQTGQFSSKRGFYNNSTNSFKNESISQNNSSSAKLQTQNTNIHFNKETNNIIQIAVMDPSPMSTIFLKQTDIVSYDQEQIQNREVFSQKDLLDLKNNTESMIEKIQVLDDVDLNSENKDRLSTDNKKRFNLPKMPSKMSMSKSNTIFDDEYFFEDNEQKSVKKQRYMNPELFHKLRDHHVEWDYSVFFEFLAYHLMFYILIGPFTIIPLYKKVTLMRNLSFWGNKGQFYMQSIFYFLNAFNLIFYFTSENTHIYTVEIVYMEIVVFLRAYIIACKYATLHPDKIELYRQFELQGELTANDFYFARWVQQSFVIIYRESYNSFQRGEYDASMFFLDFFVKISQETQKQIDEGIEKLKIWHKHEHEPFQPQSIYPQENSIYGYGVINYIIQQFIKGNQNKYLFLVAFIVSLFRGFLLLIYRYISNDKDSLNFTTTEIVQMVGIIYNTTFGYFSSLIFFIFFTKDLRMKNYLQKQCILILSPKKLKIGVKKVLPTINFTDPFSLKTWSILRRVLLDYGKAYFLRLEAFISIYVFVGFFSLVAVLLWLFKVYQLPTNIGIACGFEAIFVLFFLLFILIQGAIINSSFEINKNILTDYQILFDDILRLRKFYFMQGTKSANMIRQRAIEKIKKYLNLSETFNDEDSEKVQNHINDVLNGLNDCNKELEQDSENSPFLFFGVKITKTLVQNIVMGLGTTAMAVVQYYLSR